MKTQYMKTDISKESIEYQKKIAIEMWQFVKKWYIKHPDACIHPMFIKADFVRKYYNKTGQKIDWKSHCILCEKFHDDYCHGCPLYKDDTDMFCADYFNLFNENVPFHKRPSICDKIIEAIKSFKG